MPHDPSTQIDFSSIEGDVAGHLDHLERQLGSLTTQVQRLQRLASLGTVSAVLAHEFNNILTPMVSGSQHALTRCEPESMKKALEKSLRAGQRLATLCDKILGMATGDTRGPSVAPVGPAIREAVDCMGRDPAKDDITLTLDVPEGLAARFTPASLQQVVFNLALNARQAMAGRPGRLTISARAMAAESATTATAQAAGAAAAPIAGGRVEIMVSDTGCGIRPENLDRVFEPFFTTKQHESRLDRGGVGLGLHVCRQLMTEMGGSIQVESKAGVGTTFRLVLPAD